MTTKPITAPTTTDIARQLYAAQTALAEARAHIAAMQTASAALTRVPVTPTPLYTLLDDTARDVARLVVRLEIADHPADTSELDREALAQLLSEGDVHVHDGDYPTWDDLAESGQDQYRTLATFLAARCVVSPRVPAAEGSAA